MIATNHAMAGAIIGATMPLQYAIPAALASHIVLDALPHYGIEFKIRDGSTWYRRVVFTDTAVALTIAAITAFFGQWQMFLVGWVSYGPDGYWVYLYYKKGKSFDVDAQNWFATLHHKIQTLERPWGIYVDIAVAAILLPIFAHYVTA